MKTVNNIWNQRTENIREKRDHEKNKKHESNNKWLSFIFHKSKLKFNRRQFTNCCAFSGRFLLSRPFVMRISFCCVAHLQALLAILPKKPLLSKSNKSGN